MQLVIAILLIGGASTYLASLVCRLLRSRHKRPAWLLAPAVAALTGVITVLATFQGEVFHPSRWESGKVSFIFAAAIFFGFSMVVGLIPAWYVIGYYRDRFEESK